MIETIEYINPRINRSEWGGGEWDGEPDKVQWQGELPCLAVRSHMGHWCGYVGVSPEHPLYGKGEWSDVGDLKVHGGITFTGKCQDGEECATICHKAPEDDVWWLGFDCAGS